jgi:hypothetical protein
MQAPRNDSICNLCSLPVLHYISFEHNSNRFNLVLPLKVHDITGQSMNVLTLNNFFAMTNFLSVWSYENDHAMHI